MKPGHTRREKIGRVIGRYKMAKHVTWSIDGDGIFTWRRDDAAVAAGVRLDGLCVIRTSLSETELDGPGTVRAYKRLGSAERAIRSLKTVDLEVRPDFHAPNPAPTSSCACSPGMWSGTCAGSSSL